MNWSSRRTCRRVSDSSTWALETWSLGRPGILAFKFTRNFTKKDAFQATNFQGPRNSKQMYQEARKGAQKKPGHGPLKVGRLKSIFLGEISGKFEGHDSGAFKGPSFKRPSTGIRGLIPEGRSFQVKKRAIRELSPKQRDSRRFRTGPFRG